ncbi:MAG: chromate transporter [Clostridia bacterium]|nr:chromate transporter [Clostridia bacterium]
MKKLLELFLIFLKIGAFTFGGGYAMIPLIQKEAAEKKGWIKKEDILEIVAVAESTPGPIAINAATLIGFRHAGFFGAFFATLGVVLPSFVIIVALTFIFEAFKNNRVVAYAFAGIRAGVLALLIHALYTMFKQTQKNAFSYIIMGAAFIAVAVFKVNILFVVIGAAVLGLVYSFMVQRRAKK